MKRNFFSLISAFLISALFLFPGGAEAGLVDSGNKISFLKSELTSPDNMVTINWSQSSQKKTANYAAVAAVNKSSKDVFPLFVQKERIDKLLAQSECDAGGDCVAQVSNDFQYGQDKKKTERFLVYHNKLNKPYQHRFVSTTTLSKFANAAESLAKVEGIPIPGVDSSIKTFGSIVKLGKAVFGDYLRSY